jgi:hypothetical protein
MTNKDPSIVGYECKFVIYIPPNQYREDDYHLIKENIHYVDGTIKPNVRLIKNYNREFYVTKKAYRNHTDKKDFEEIDKLNKYTTTQSKMPRSVANALELQYLSNPDMRTLSNSPYLYGSEISSSAIIKGSYKRKYPDLFSPYKVSAFDIEIDVTNGPHNGEINVLSLTMGDKFVCAISEYFLQGHNKEEVKEAIMKYIGDYIIKRKMSMYIEICKDEMECLFKIFSYAHEWKPDFMAIWNMDFDLPKIVERCRANNVYPEDLFSDPKIPRNIRNFYYKQGQTRKTKSNGQVSIITPANRWHKALSTSSFYFIDAMCVYRQIRLSKPEEQSYSLDAILNKELGIRKLKFKEADQYSGLDWHYHMQTKYPLEYIAYNIFDTLSMIELDEKTQDLTQALPVLSQYSDYTNFNSKPRQLIDLLHWEALDNNCVIGCAGNELKDEIDEKTLPLDDWIIALEPSLIVDNGLRNIKEDKSIRTNIHLYNADSDIASAYPTDQCLFNVSRSTTLTELIDIVGVHPSIYRIENINLLSGEVNSIDYCCKMFNFPTLSDLDSLLDIQGDQNER